MYARNKGIWISVSHCGLAVFVLIAAVDSPRLKLSQRPYKNKWGDSILGFDLSLEIPQDTQQ